MIRYCTKCEKEYDFPIKSMGDMDHLICPVCGEKVDRESRKPRDLVREEKTEIAIGRTIMAFLNFWFYLYLICGIVGIVAFLLKWDVLLYLVTAVSVFLFFKPSGRYRNSFFQSTLWLAAGAGAGFFFFRSVQGACFGVEVSLVIRHIVMVLLMKLFSLLIRWVRKL